TVEEGDPYSTFARKRGQRDLGLLQGPARGDDAAVLGAVGVAEHHDLAITARGEVAPVYRVGEQLAQGRLRGLEVGDGLEQRGDVERDFVILYTAGQPRQCEHRERIRGTAAHADDVRSEHALAIPRSQRGDGAEHIQHR